MKKTAADPVPKKPRRRHGFLFVLIMANVLLYAGIFLGAVFWFLFHKFFPEASADIVFVIDAYFPFIGVLIVLPAFCARFEKDIFKSMLSHKRGFAKGNTPAMFLWGLLTGFAMNALCIIFSWVSGDLTFSFGAFNLPYLLFALLFVLVQCAAEEMVYRGYLQKAIMERYGLWLAVLANGLAFGLTHLSNTGITLLSLMNVTMYGVTLSMAAYYLDSLWFCIAHHTAWNFTQNFIFGLPNSGLAAENSILTLSSYRSGLLYDEVFGIEGGPVILLIEILAAVLLFLYFRRPDANRAPDPLESGDPQ